MSTTTTTPIIEPASAPISGPGTLLQEARERAGLSLQLVAKELHMSVAKVKAIEANEYTQLKSDTFIRGYLRAYASYLKLDCAQVIQAYQQHARTQGFAPESHYQIPKESSSKKLWVFVIGLFGVLFGLWLISIWFFDNQVDREVVPPVITEPLAPVQESPVKGVTAEKNTAEKDVETTYETSSASVEEPAAIESEASASITKVVDAPAESVNEPQASLTLDTLHIEFDDECWLEVSDSQGDVLATELQRAGSSVTLSGVAPFSVKLGNARAVKMTLNGSGVAINPPSGARVMVLNVGE